MGACTSVQQLNPQTPGTSAGVDISKRGSEGSPKTAKIVESDNTIEEWYRKAVDMNSDWVSLQQKTQDGKWSTIPKEQFSTMFEDAQKRAAIWIVIEKLDEHRAEQKLVDVIRKWQSNLRIRCSDELAHHAHMIGNWLQKHGQATENFEFNASNCVRIQDFAIKSLSGALNGMTRLQTLSLNLSGCPILGNDALKEFSGALKTNTKLTKLSLNMRGSPWVRQEFLKNVADCLQKNTATLNELELDFSNCVKINGTSLKPLYSIISNLVHLEKFQFSLNNCIDLGDEPAIQMINSLNMLPKITNLSWDFSNCAAVSVNTLDAFIAYLQKKPLIDGLSFKIAEASQVTSASVVKLAETIREMKSLKSLELDLSGCSAISDDGVSLLGPALLNLPLLRKLDLNFGEVSMTPDGVAILFKSVAEMHELHELALRLKSLPVSEQCFKLLLDRLKSLNRLEVLILDVSNDGLVNDAVLQHFENFIKSVFVLKTINLTYSKCLRITAGGLTPLIDALKDKTQLKWEVDCSNCLSVPIPMRKRLTNCDEVSSVQLSR